MAETAYVPTKEDFERLCADAANLLLQFPC